LCLQEKTTLTKRTSMKIGKIRMMNNLNRMLSCLEEILFKHFSTDITLIISWLPWVRTQLLLTHQRYYLPKKEAKHLYQDQCLIQDQSVKLLKIKNSLRTHKVISNMLRHLTVEKLLDRWEESIFSNNWFSNSCSKCSYNKIHQAHR
jgi:hypothetical protein